MEKLTNEGRQARAEYMRKWRKANPDKVKESKDRYWNKKAKQAQRKGNE